MRPRHGHASVKLAHVRPARPLLKQFKRRPENTHIGFMQNCITQCRLPLANEHARLYERYAINVNVLMREHNPRGMLMLYAAV